METPKGFYERTKNYLNDVGIDVSDVRVLVGGAGTLGSRVVRNLARFNFNKIVVVDFDFVGAENVGYQCYHTEEIGRPKATTLAERLNKFHPWTKIEGVYMEVFTLSGLSSLESLKKLDEIVQDVDVLVSLFDNLAARATFLALAVRNEKKFVDAGLGVSRGYVKVLKEGYCPICERVREDRVVYYTNPNLAEVVAAFVAQAVLYVSAGREWPSEITVNMDAPFSPVSASDVVNANCPLCDEEVKRIELDKLPTYLLKNVY